MCRARRTFRGARGASTGPTAPASSRATSRASASPQKSSSKEPTADLSIRVSGPLPQLLPRHPRPLSHPPLCLPNSPPPCPDQCRGQVQSYPLLLLDSAPFPPRPFLELPGHTAFRLIAVLCLGSPSRLLNPAREADPARGGLTVYTRRFLPHPALDAAHESPASLLRDSSQGTGHEDSQVYLIYLTIDKPGAVHENASAR